MTLIIFIIFFVLAYLLGSVNSAILVSKLMGLPDPRTQGSGNPGATNVLRSGNKVAAAAVLIGDVLKGMIPVLLASMLLVHGFLLAMIGLAAVTGHIYPVFFRFEGGKGVATTMGVIFSLSLGLGIITLLILVLVVAFTRYVSLGSISAIIAAPILALFGGHAAYFVPLMLIAALVLFRHKENIARLRDGIENKFKF